MKDDYPMVAPAYAKERSALAKKIGLSNATQQTCGEFSEPGGLGFIRGYGAAEELSKRLYPMKSVAIAPLGACSENREKTTEVVRGSACTSRSSLHLQNYRTG